MNAFEAVADGRGPCFVNQFNFNCILFSTMCTSLYGTILGEHEGKNRGEKNTILSSWNFPKHRPWQDSHVFQVIRLINELRRSIYQRQFLKFNSFGLPEKRNSILMMQTERSFEWLHVLHLPTPDVPHHSSMRTLSFKTTAVETSFGTCCGSFRIFPNHNEHPINI